MRLLVGRVSDHRGPFKHGGDHGFIPEDMQQD
jgi:hypothetical protein